MKFIELLTSKGTVTPLVLVIVGSWVTYSILTVLYNLSRFHPLSRIPGPLLARATILPEFYYDFIKYGRYTHVIKRMHEKYGPIVRISPNEVHCNDINFVDEIYSLGGRKRNKTQHYVNCTAIALSEFATVEHDLHRTRRAPVVRFFSRGMITKLESHIHDLVHILCDKLLSSVHEPVDLVVAYSCFSSDAISAYCFGETFGFMEREGWFSDFHTAELEILRPVYVFRFFPFFRQFARYGKYFVDYLPKEIALLIRTLRIDVPNKILKTKQELDAGVYRDRPTIFSSLLSDPKRKKELDLVDEAGILLGAGTETTAWFFVVVTYHLLNKPELLERLHKELSQAVEDPRNLPTWSALESLPYLNAVVREGLRLSYGVPTRSARVPVHEDLIYRGNWKGEPVKYVIPRGYGIGMSNGITHHDESVFPDSYSFIPERWFDEKNRKQLDRGLVAFSKGARACLGMNLAYCEIYVGLAALVLRVLPKMKLFETTVKDVQWDYDMIIPMPSRDSKGMRVTISPD
ncbi:cytochrome P450 [Hypoxylon rubiginosum]|uniref:Cytochrome P450 n=1 Tax=Hypoxylon rubiginosum TaxID=110542 RepID=A0ACC0DGV0_9PEZI|nr:cytochrome P450 [Hypoxylon rubiginosum]